MDENNSDEHDLGEFYYPDEVEENNAFPSNSQEQINAFIVVYMPKQKYKFARVCCMRGNFVPYNKSLNNLVSSVYTRKISDLGLLCMDLASLGPYTVKTAVWYFSSIDLTLGYYVVYIYTHNQSRKLHLQLLLFWQSPEVSRVKTRVLKLQWLAQRQSRRARTRIFQTTQRPIIDDNKYNVLSHLFHQ